MIESVVKCDGCGGGQTTGSGPNRTPIHVVREMLKTTMGWRCGLPGGLDFCRECWSERRNREQP